LLNQSLKETSLYCYKYYRSIVRNVIPNIPLDKLIE
jgi:hypothetical protein